MHTTKALLMGLCVVLTMATDTLAQKPLSGLEQRMPSHALDNNRYDPSKPSLSGLEQRVIALEARDAALQRARRVPVVVDALGHVVGVVLEQFSPPNDNNRQPSVLLEVAVLLDISGIPAVIHVTPSTITGFPPRNSSGVAYQLNFTGLDCTETAYVLGTYAATFGGQAIAWKDNIYIPKPEPGVNTDVHREIVLRSRIGENPNGDLVCENDSYRTVYTEALTVPVAIFDKFVPPFTLSGLPRLP